MLNTNASNVAISPRAKMRLFLRQVWALTLKNLLIALVRPAFSTVIRAFLLPIVFIIFMYVN